MNKYFFYISFLFLLCGQILPQEKPVSNPKVNSRVQSDVVRDLNLKEMQSDASRRLVYMRELVADRHFRRALEYLEEFSILFPTHKQLFEIYQLSAKSYEGIGSTMMAVQSYKKAFYQARDEGRGLDAYLRAGKILAESGQNKEARRIFEHISSIRPSSVYSRQAEFEMSSFLMKSDRFDGLQSNIDLNDKNKSNGLKKVPANKDNKPQEKALISNPVTKENRQGNKTSRINETSTTKPLEKSNDVNGLSKLRSNTELIGEGILLSD